VPKYQHWLNHEDKHSGVSSVSFLWMTLVIIHDEQAAVKTSGRPTIVMADKLCGYGNVVLCQGYARGLGWNRKLLHQELSTKVSAAELREIQEVEVRRQLRRALEELGRLVEHS
jgi:hypothetical protein